MAINFGGLSSGLDTNNIVTQLVAAEKIPMDRLNAKKQSLSDASASLTSFMGRLSTLRTAATSLSTPTSFSSFSAASSDPSLVTTITGVTSPGSYNVTVNALAREQRTNSNTYASSSDALGVAGTLTLQAGAGTPVTLSILNTDSLAAVASKISSSGARVSASVIYDGTNYRLQVRGLDQGASNALTFGGDPLGLGFDVPANTVQAASNSSITVDGVTISRPTNQITGVIPGVTLVAKKPGITSTIDISPDSAALTTKIQSIVSAYNDVVSSGHLTAGYGGVKAANSLLAGDSTIRSSLDRLSRLFGSNVAGTTGKYDSMMTIGLSLDKTGALALDTTKLNAAVAADPTAVSRLFVTDTATGATGLMGTIATAVDSLTVGTTAPLQARISGWGSQSTRIDSEVAQMQVRLDSYESNLRKQFTAMEAAMSTIKSNGDALVGALTAASGSRLAS